MQVVIVYGKPHIALSGDLMPISEREYYEMIERSEIESIDFIEYD